MCFGAFISLIVDAALFEVLSLSASSLHSVTQVGQSPYFAMLFGLCLIVIGGLIIWRVAPEPGERMTRWRFLVFVFSTLILSSGICCEHRTCFSLPHSHAGTLSTPTPPAPPARRRHHRHPPRDSPHHQHQHQHPIDISTCLYFYVPPPSHSTLQVSSSTRIGWSGSAQPLNFQCTRS